MNITVDDNCVQLFNGMMMTGKKICIRYLFGYY
mgnify:CR=1 FL=1